MKFVAPCLYAVSTAVLAAIALALTFGGLTSGLASVSLSLGAMVAAFALWRNLHEPTRWRQLNGWAWGAALLFTLFALRAFLWLVFFDGDNLCVLSPNNLGDLALHLTYIREVANGVPFWPTNPIFAGTKLSYPIGVDLLHSLLVLSGADLWRTFIWMGLAGSLLTMLMLFRWGGAFAVLGFLCNGGLAGAALFLTGHFADYQAQLGWKSIPLALFTTQRGFLFAVPAGLLLLCSWKARYFPRQGDPERPLPRWGEWLLYASMPVFHFHTFLFLSILLGVWFCFYAAPRREVGRLVLLALLPASVLVLLITDFFHGPKALGWAPGWMQDAPEYLAWCRTHLLPNSPDAETAPILGTGAVWLTRPVFWLLNFGVLPFLLVALVRTLWQDRTAVRERAFLVPALAIFLLCCFVKFAQWEWDNTKLMVWSYLILLPILWHRLLRPWPYSVRALACVALFGSGFVCLLGGLNGGAGLPVASRVELDGMEQDLRAISPRERFLARPNYNQPLLLLGRPVVAGYEGHLLSHGYDYQDTFAKVKSVLNGENGWRQIAKSLGARYLLWGRQEIEEYADSAEPWKTTTRVVASGAWGTVYDLESQP